MYLDKGMRDHTLLQAIARVNRPYTELKEFGLILDYFGAFENLNDALNFDKMVPAHKMGQLFCITDY